MHSDIFWSWFLGIFSVLFHLLDCPGICAFIFHSCLHRCLLFHCFPLLALLFFFCGFDLPFRVQVFATWSTLWGSCRTSICMWVELALCSEQFWPLLNAGLGFRRSASPCTAERVVCCPVHCPSFYFLLVVVLGMQVSWPPSIHLGISVFFAPHRCLLRGGRQQAIRG